MRFSTIVFVLLTLACATRPAFTQTSYDEVFFSTHTNNGFGGGGFDICPPCLSPPNVDPPPGQCTWVCFTLEQAYARHDEGCSYWSDVIAISFKITGANGEEIVCGGTISTEPVVPNFSFQQVCFEASNCPLHVEFTVWEMYGHTGCDYTVSGDFRATCWCD